MSKVYTAEPFHNTRPVKISAQVPTYVTTAPDLVGLRRPPLPAVN